MASHKNRDTPPLVPSTDTAGPRVVLPTAACLAVIAEPTDRIDTALLLAAARECLDARRRHQSKRDPKDIVKQRSCIDRIARHLRAQHVWHAAALEGDDADRVAGVAKLLHAARRHELYQNDPPSDVWRRLEEGVALLEAGTT